MKIRTATQDDADAVRFVHEAAFPEGERDLVSQLAVELLSEETSQSVLSLLSEVHGKVVAHVAFSSVTTRDRKEPIGYILAPLAVSPTYQGQHIASQLIKNGVQRLSESGARMLFVYGDPKFYGKFGFSVEHAEPYVPPYPLQYPFGWQGMALGEFDAPSASVELSCVSPLDRPALW